MFINIPLKSFQCFIILPAQLPEELVTCGSCVHEGVGYNRSCVAHWISNRVLE